MQIPDGQSHVLTTLNLLEKFNLLAHHYLSLDKLFIGEY